MGPKRAVVVILKARPRMAGVNQQAIVSGRGQFTFSVLDATCNMGVVETVASGNPGA